MGFTDRMRELLDQGVAVSKDLAAKASTKAQDLGEIGVLMVEIRQLEGQAQKLIGRLGAEVYQIFTERKEQTIDADSAPIRALLNEISDVRSSIEKKEAELQNKKGR